MHPLCSIGLSRENHGCRFEGIANSILQGNGAQNLESWQNRLLQNAQSSASAQCLGDSSRTTKAIAIDNDLRGTLRNFGLKVGMVGAVRFEARIRKLVENLPDQIGRAHV